MTTTAILLCGVGLALIGAGIVIGLGWLFHGRQDE